METAAREGRLGRSLSRIGDSNDRPGLERRKTVHRACKIAKVDGRGQHMPSTRQLQRRRAFSCATCRLITGVAPGPNCLSNCAKVAQALGT